MKIKSIVGFLIVGGSLWLSSCKDDEPTKSGVSFEISEESIKESDGTLESFHPGLVDNAEGREIEVKIEFDEPLAQTSVIAYSVGGSAEPNSTTKPYGDYAIVGNGENIVVEKGATEATIIIKLFEDFEVEIEEEDDDGYIETIEITLESVISGSAKIGEQDTYVLTIYEDDTLIYLGWDVGDETSGDVDIDLLLWFEGGFQYGSDNPAGQFEAIAIAAGFPDQEYGMSYPYYSGTSNDLEFFVDIINLGGTLNTNDQLLSFTGNYTLANINKYDEEGAPDPLVVQTMDKSGFNYTNVTDIGELATGSRKGRSTLSLKDRLKGVNISTLENRSNFKRK